MLEFIEDNFISKLISEPTSENNTFDFVIASKDYLIWINNIVIIEHLVGLCDHKSSTVTCMQLPETIGCKGLSEDSSLKKRQLWSYLVEVKEKETKK